MLPQSSPQQDGNARAARIVYVIDDDASLQRALRRLLERAGFSVRTFGCAEEFLQATHRPPPDCLVLDINLGALSGFDLHHRMVASGVLVPTIFITGYDDPATRELVRKAGAAGYLPKPFEDQSLISAIEAALVDS